MIRQPRAYARLLDLPSRGRTMRSIGRHLSPETAPCLKGSSSHPAIIAAETTSRRSATDAKAEDPRSRRPARAYASPIAIDGPVASGKSAVGSSLARKLGYRFIDTGVMYRAVTWLALERDVDLDDEAALTRLAESALLEVEPERVLIDGVDVTNRLRSPEVGEAVSLVSRVPGVRHAMVEQQRRLAASGGVVMAGRDIGTVVLPDAPMKVYLDASVEERVRRRHDELAAAGKQVSLPQVRDELALRDTIDSERAMSPLRPADDAVVIHTDDLSLDQVVARILELARCS